MENATQQNLTGKHLGGCHCGAVRYEVDIEKPFFTRCNCSICVRLQSTGALVSPARFRLLAGADRTFTYEFGTKVGKRHFCRTCGVYVFGTGHLEVLGGDYVSVNANTIDDLDPNALPLAHWDGRHDNWQAGPRDTPWPIAP